MNYSWNSLAIKALYSADYCESYLECVESLPTDLQRSISLLRETDCRYLDIQREMNNYVDIYQELPPNKPGKKLLTDIQNCLQKFTYLSAEKNTYITRILSQIEQCRNQLQQNADCLRQTDELATCIAKGPNTSPSRIALSPPPTQKPGRRHKRPSTITDFPKKDVNEYSRVNGISMSPISKRAKSFNPNNGIRKRMRTPSSNHKAKLAVMSSDSTGEETPKTNSKSSKASEPVYCLCNRVSFGEMVACDHTDCEIEWFHFDCVGLKSSPRGKWFCPNCTSKIKESSAAPSAITSSKRMSKRLR